MDTDIRIYNKDQMRQWQRIRYVKEVTQLCHRVCTTIAVSSSHAASKSRVKALETLVVSSPSACLSSLNAKLSLGCLGPGSAALILSDLHLFKIRWPDEPDDLLTIFLAHLLIILFCISWLPHKSAKPSDARMRNHGVSLSRLFVAEYSSKRRWTTSGSAVIYGGVKLRARNSSQGETLWNPGSRLYSTRLVNSGGCLNGTSPKPRGAY